MDTISKDGGDTMAINYDKYLYSTGTHYISNSGGDENGGTKGGKAGDQTGREWQLRSFYKRPWTVVLRYPDQRVALEIAKLGIAAALNNNIGYDQSQRATYWKQLQAVGYDPYKIDADHKCEEDCTAGVTANVRACGYIFGIPALQGLDTSGTRSSNMKPRFVKAGFKALTASKYLTSGNYLLPGDILLYENHHAATNVTLGAKVKNEWHPDSTPTKPTEDDDTMKKVVVTGDSVFVRKGPSTDYGTMGAVHKDDKLSYFGYDYPDNGWHLVEYDKATGWISGKYSRVEG